MDQFFVLRAAVLEDEATYGKCDPGRIRKRIYHTVKLVSWATNYLLERLYQRTTRDHTIRQRRAAGGGVSDLVREYGVSPARISQIIHNKHKLYFAHRVGTSAEATIERAQQDYGTSDWLARMIDLILLGEADYLCGTLFIR